MKSLEITKDWRSEKRSKNGSVRKNRNGSFTARKQWIDQDGKKREATRTAATKTEAQRLISQMSEHRLNHGDTAIQSEKMKFVDLMERYEKTQLQEAIYDESGNRILGLRSIAPVRSALKPLKEYFGRRIVKDIRISDIETYKAQRLRTPVTCEINLREENPFGGRKKYITTKETTFRPRKIASVNRELELLRKVFRFAKAESLLISSPFDNKSLVSASRETQRDRVMSHEEELRLLAVCVEPRAHLRAIIITALDTAMRRGEIFKLRWCDLDLPNRIITVQGENTKTEKSRIIAMTNRVLDEFTMLWESSPKDQNGLVFGITNSIKISWKSACTKAEISGLRFHDLRHTATTRFVRAGMPLSEAMKITGHSQLKTFQRYMNLTNESVTACANLLDSYLEKEMVRPDDITQVTMVQ